MAPPALLPEIDRINEYVYECVNSGVYRAGFATKPAAYAAAFEKLFTALDWLEARLTKQRHLCGEIYGSHKQLNPSGIVPLGPVQDFSQPHDRTRFAKK